MKLQWKKTGGCIEEYVDYPQVGNQSLRIFISCTEINLYFYLKCFLKKDA